jgi:nitrogen fixation NifU-like protein
MQNKGNSVLFIACLQNKAVDQELSDRYYLYRVKRGKAKEFLMELLYQEIIRDHYQNPRHKGCIAHPTFASVQHNPSCGDSISWQGTLEHGVLTNIAFQGVGCVISQATASLLAQAVIGKQSSEIMSLDATFISQLIGISLGPTRLKCALLSLMALQSGLI